MPKYDDTISGKLCHKNLDNPSFDFAEHLLDDRSRFAFAFAGMHRLKINLSDKCQQKVMIHSYFYPSLCPPKYKRN